MKTSTTKWENIASRVNLAGVQFSDYQRVAACLKPGLVLALIGEPSNPHDPYAVRVEHAGICIGWIPAKSIHQSELWNAHSNGYKSVAVLTAFNRTNPTWMMITVQLKRCLINGKKLSLKSDIKF